METPKDEIKETPNSIWELVRMFCKIIHITLYGFKFEQKLWTDNTDTQKETKVNKKDL
jgi:hypothetical protein